MNRILKYMWRYKLLLTVPTLAMLFSIALNMFNPYLSKLFIDRVIKNNELKLFPMIIAAIAAIGLLMAVLEYIKEYLFDLLSSKVHKDLKDELFNHIDSLSFSYFDNMNTGELMSRMGEDIENIWRSIGFGIRLFVENAIYFIVTSIILLILNRTLALACLVIIVPLSFIALKLEKKIGDVYGKISDQAASINTTAQENIAGVRLVKAFAREKYEINKFLKLNNNNYNLNMELAKVTATYFPPMEFLTNVCVVIVIILGGILVIKQNLTLGTLVAFTGYIWNLIWPMRMLGWLTSILSQNMASCKKIFKILDTKPEIKDKENPIRLEDVKGHIRFNNVSFKYSNDYVLKNINIDAKQGSTIAIMGTTGSGKSSIVNLIGRFYDVCEGCVTIDGYDIKDLCLQDIRKKLSVVPQDTFLFSETIEQNIRFGKENASIEEIENACKTACADDFIGELKDGYKTIIGERGIGLSGGQKQRLAIARALVRDCRILILDDATSALDMDTEYNLLKNLQKSHKKVTTFIIAHRISAVKNADEIIFMQDGYIAERGTHEELLSKHGLYYEVYSEQYREFTEDDKTETEENDTEVI